MAHFDLTSIIEKNKQILNLALKPPYRLAQYNEKLLDKPPRLGRGVSADIGMTRQPNEISFLDIITRPDVYDIIFMNVGDLFNTLLSDGELTSYMKWIPSVYLKGGSAYKVFDMYIDSIKHFGFNESMFVPRTDDFDIIIEVKDKNNFDKFRPFIKGVVEKLSIDFASYIPTYFDVLGDINFANYDEIKTDTEHEIIGDKFILSVRKFERDTTSNCAYRVSLKQGEYIGTIIEVIVTINSDNITKIIELPLTTFVNIEHIEIKIKEMQQQLYMKK
jgi:hypothetical protein